MKEAVRRWGPLAAIAACGLTLLGMDWSTRRPVAEFAETLVAGALYLTITLGSLAAAIWAGIQVAKRTKLQAVGWVVGVLVVFGVYYACMSVATKIPGVGWRIERQMESSSEPIGV